MRLAASVSVAIILSALAGGCVSDSRPDASACAVREIQIELRLTAERLTPSPSVCREQAVTLRIASEVDGFFHIHGYEDAVSATEVVAGETLELTFSAGRAGQFPIELHPADDPEGITIGVLTVNEP